MDAKTHIATNKWTVGPYTFLEAMPKIGTQDDAKAYWVMKGDALLSRNSFASIEEAMRYAARPSGGSANLVPNAD
jgi:hypothetical protein